MLKILWIMVRWAIQAFLLACSVLSTRKIEQSWADGECRDRLGLSMTLNGQFQPRSMPAQFAYIYTVSAWVSTNFQIRPWMDFQRSPMKLHGFHCLLAQNVKETFFLWSCQQLKWSAVWVFFLCFAFECLCPQEYHVSLHISFLFLVTSTGV